MTKTSTRTKSARGKRGRDAEFPSAPIHVSEDAQAKKGELNIARHLNIGRRERDGLPERPSTSGGPTVNFSMRKNAEKRETKDDLHFNPLAAHGRGPNFYDFPLPGSLPTSTQDPNSSPPTQHKSSIARSPSPDSTPDAKVANTAVMAIQQAEIGMALGSPSHQPTLSQTQTYYSSNVRGPSLDIDPSMDSYSNASVPLKHKPSKWKILGGLFSGKKQNNPQAFYQLQPEVTQQASMDEGYGYVDEVPAASDKKPKSRGRGRTNSEKKSGKQRPDMERTKTAPVRFDFQVEEPRNQPANPESTIDGSGANNVNQSQQNQSGPFLDVNIPSTQMERYSIMFGSVLQKSATASSSSLLARRQATLDRLKSVNEALASKERELEERARQLRPRRATSPQPTKSPAFSLFPSTPSRLTVRDASPGPSVAYGSLQRSNTSPAALSPSRPSFAPQADNEVHAILVAPGPHIPTNPRPKGKPLLQGKKETKASHKIAYKEETALPPPPMEKWSPEEPSLAPESPTSFLELDEEEDNYNIKVPLKKRLDEPQWKMITPHKQNAPSSASDSSTESEGHSTSTSASSISTSSIPHVANPKHVQIQAPPAARRNRSATTSSATRPRPSEVSNADFGAPLVSINKPLALPKSLPLVKPIIKPTTHEDDEREERLKSAADISIARQISVSRQQRQLLVPVKKPSLHLKSPNPNFPSPSPLNINRVASPLGVVAAAAESPIAGKPLVRRGTAERLVSAGANPSTPTLVVVGSGTSEVERAWVGTTEAFSREGSQEIRVGLAIESPAGNRRSERVVVEGIAAN